MKYSYNFISQVNKMKPVIYKNNHYQMINYKMEWIKAFLAFYPLRDKTK